MTEIVVPALAEIPGIGECDINKLSLADLYVPFEGLGNNCEFGIVQRSTGYDPPGLFRNVGFISPEAIIEVINRGLAGMFDDGNFEFVAPDGWPDWRLDCRIAGMGFHTGIPTTLTAGSVEWNSKTRQAITLFRFLKRTFQEDLRSGEKIFVFRHNVDAAEHTIARLYAALRQHGPNWLLYVTQDPRNPSGWIERRKATLLVAGINRLSNENPPVIDFNAWEKIARQSLRERWQPSLSSKNNEIFEDDLSEEDLIVPPEPYLAVIKHSVARNTTVDRPLFNIFVEGLLANTSYIFELLVLIPQRFCGNNISVVMWGAYSEEFNSVDLNLRNVWQRLFVKSSTKDENLCLMPSLLANSNHQTVFYTSGWRLTAAIVEQNLQLEQNINDNEMLPIGYLYNNGGLNNQKAALAGLVVAAYATGTPMFLPDMFVLDHAGNNSGTVAFDEVYEIGPFLEFLQKYNISLRRRPETFETNDPHGWTFFRGDQEYQVPANFGFDLSNSLVPIILKSKIFEELYNRIFVEKKAPVALQLRIEQDWVEHSVGLKSELGDAEDFCIPYIYIFSKVFNTFGCTIDSLYIVSDEGNLSVDKETIRSTVISTFGYKIYWKSDFIEPLFINRMSALDLSILDFEMAVRADYFVGLTRSTFSNNVSWEKHCRTQVDVTTHYIYNNALDSLSLRTDNGMYSDPEQATRT